MCDVITAVVGDGGNILVRAAISICTICEAIGGALAGEERGA